MSREYAGASVVGRALCAMGILCALAGILLEGVSARVRVAGPRGPGTLATSWRGVPPEIHLHRADVSCEHSLREHAGG